MSDLDRLLMTMLEYKASDLHLNHNTKISYRVDGEIKQVGPIIKGRQIFELMLPALSSEQQRIYYEKKSIDFSYELKELKVRFRGSLIFQKGEPSCVLRKINSQVVPIEKFDLPMQVREVALKNLGLILVTGPTGSGKSTTLASIIDYINRNRFGHIATIEEPVEYVHENKNCIVTQREVGRDSSSFEESMRTVLRQDPDVILVGEMRDLETVSAAVTNAETGHLVLGTLHTNNAPQAIQRIIDMYPHEKHSAVRAQLANNLKLVISQRLFKNPEGGRRAEYEIMFVDDEIAHLIREGRDLELYEAMSRKLDKGNRIANFS